MISFPFSERTFSYSESVTSRGGINNLKPEKKAIAENLSHGLWSSASFISPGCWICLTMQRCTCTPLIPQRHTLAHKYKPRQTKTQTCAQTQQLTDTLCYTHKCRHSLSLSLSHTHTHTHTHKHTHTYKTLLSNRVNPWPGKTATSIFNSSLTSSKCLLAEHKYKIVTQKKKPDLCASFKNAFLMVRSYNYRPAFRLNETHNQDIREASQDYEICRPREDEKFHPARTS